MAQDWLTHDCFWNLDEDELKNKRNTILDYERKKKKENSTRKKNGKNMNSQRISFLSVAWLLLHSSYFLGAVFTCLFLEGHFDGVWKAVHISAFKFWESISGPRCRCQQNGLQKPTEL